MKLIGNKQVFSILKSTVEFPKYYWKIKKIKISIKELFLYFHNDFFVIIRSADGQLGILINIKKNKKHSKITKTPLKAKKN